MSKESYARGFCKAAEAHGVDPTALAKYAQLGIFRNGPTIGNAAFERGFQKAQTATPEEMRKQFGKMPKNITGSVMMAPQVADYLNKQYSENIKNNAFNLSSPYNVMGTYIPRFSLKKLMKTPNRFPLIEGLPANYYKRSR